MRSDLKKAVSKLLWRALHRYTQDERFDDELLKQLSPWMLKLSRRHDLFERFQRAGFNLIPNDYLQPIPDLTSIGDDTWSRPRECEGIDFREAAEVELIHRFRNAYSREYATLGQLDSGAPSHWFRFGNGTFESVDAEILYCFVRDLRPRTVIEVGAGYSTLVTAAAIRRNAADGHDTRLKVIEPYPREFIRDGSIREIDELITDKLENVPVTVFESLGAGDLLFVDSSHVARIGGDVNYLFFDILPALVPGVVVHIHDVMLPEEYIREFVLEKHWFWNEQYLMHAFLMYNQVFEVLWAGNYMRVRRESLLREAFPSYEAGKTFPGSFWIRRADR